MQKQTLSLSSKDLRGYLESSITFYQDLLGYKPEVTRLNILSDNQWNSFCNQFGLKPNTLGAYLPRNQLALVRSQPESAPLNLFHEYFGHGLYCEQSLGGEKLVELEKKLLEEEKQEFGNGQFTLEDIKRFRQQNKTFQEIQIQRKKNYSTYEGFAVFVEYLLSGKFNLNDLFEKKYGSWSSESRKGLEQIINFNKQYGNLATFYQFGLAKTTTLERVKKLLKEIYGKRINEIKFALLYGSQKPFSDIDIFIVSNALGNIDASWIDIRTFGNKEFEDKIRLFDVAVIDPITTGRFILGDEKYFQEIRKQIHNQPITLEAINYNLIEAQNQARFSQNYPEKSKENKTGLSYAVTSILLADNLRKGNRIFTKKELIDSLSHSEKETLLKGGILT